MGTEMRAQGKYAGNALCPGASCAEEFLLKALGTTLDRYIAGQLAGKFAGVLVVVVCLMLLEHMPRLFEMVHMSGSKGYIIIQTLFGLVPEYSSIALLFGLYISIGMTVRQLAVRGELDAIEASGVSSMRWMRGSMLLALASAVILLLAQGWLQPWGERHIDRISRDMRAGVYGLALHPGEFAELGGAAVRFESVADDGRTLQSVFLTMPGRTITAKTGTAWLSEDGKLSLVVENGSCICRGSDGQDRTLSFSRFRFGSSTGAAMAENAPPADRMKKLSISDLAGMDSPDALAVLVSRLLWAVFALAIPALAFVLGQPPRRSSSAIGFILGFPIIVMAIRSTEFVASIASSHGIVAAVAVAMAWFIVPALLVRGHIAFQAGYIDRAMSRWLEQIPGLRERLARRPDASKRFGAVRRPAYG